MGKKEFLKYLNEIFYPLGFKRKGNTWKSESDTLRKIINLQKSKFSNTYYLNYGFIIKGLELNNASMHIFMRLSSFDDSENQKILSLLNMENNIKDEQRKFELKPIIENNMLDELQNTNNEKELLNILKKLPNLNEIPLVVKQYFHLV